MLEMKIGLIGYGVVGKAAEYTLSEGYKVIKYDKYQSLNGFDELLYCEFIFIMVPTPFDCESNKVDQSAIHESLTRLNDKSYEGVVIIKSTIPPGSCQYYAENYNLNVVFNPEFLRESTTPNEDFKEQETIVIGTDSKSHFKLVKKMYQKVAVSHAKYYHTTTKEAEMIKCAQNTMLASRVALANMIYDACKDNEINYEKVKEIAFDNFDILSKSIL